MAVARTIATTQAVRTVLGSHTAADVVSIIVTLRQIPSVIVRTTSARAP